MSLLSAHAGAPAAAVATGAVPDALEKFRDPVQPAMRRGGHVELTLSALRGSSGRTGGVPGIPAASSSVHARQAVAEVVHPAFPSRPDLRRISLCGLCGSRGPDASPVSQLG